MSTEALQAYKEAEIAIKNAYGMYLDHESRLNKALSATKNILEQAKKGVDADVYQNGVALLKKLSVTSKTFQEERMPITRAAQSIVKAFTSQENTLDYQKEGTPGFELKKLLDKYVAEIEAERKKREAFELEEKEAKREFSLLQIGIQTFFREQLEIKLNHIKKQLTALYNSISLENMEEILSEINTLADMPNFRVNKDLFLTEYAHLKRVEADAKSTLYDIFMGTEQWKDLMKQNITEVQVYASDILSRIPTLKTELEELENSSKLERKRLELEREERIRRENDVLLEDMRKKEAEMEQQKKQDEMQADLQSSFDFGNGVSDATVDGNIKTKSSYKVRLKQPVGLLEAFNFWVSNQSWPMDNEKLIRVTVDRIIKFIEKEANGGNFIKSQNIVYEEITQSKI